MKDDPMAMAEAHFLTQSMLDKGAATGDHLDDIADDIFNLFLGMELAKIEKNNPNPPEVRDAWVTALLNRVSSSSAYRADSK